jgi:toxin-antitoxin system PIN domain toxin
VTFLLDVNLLIALIDPTHVHHGAAHQWFTAGAAAAWATCPLTENGVLRIVGHPGYPNTPGSPGLVATVLQRFVQHPGHVFWPDDISMLDPKRLTTENLLGHAQITDSYLLALAVANGASLATLDRRLSAEAVVGGPAALCVVHPV